jgi:hypothetical protein
MDGLDPVRDIISAALAQNFIDLLHVPRPHGHLALGVLEATRDDFGSDLTPPVYQGSTAI